MRLISRGDLLVLLGENANKFTAFLTNPGQFNLPPDLLLAVTIARQKFEWSNNLNLDLAEVAQFIGLLRQLDVIDDQNIKDLGDWPDDPFQDRILIQVRPLDEITLDNVYGFEKFGNVYRVRVDFLNREPGIKIIEMFDFNELPSQSTFDNFLKEQVKIRRLEWSK